MKLTRREMHVLIAALILGAIFAIIRPSYETVREWEYYLWFLVVAPLGLYIATDPQRRKSGS